MKSFAALLPGAARTLAEVRSGDLHFPIPVFSLGAAPGAPTLVLVGGVHGLERIGSAVLMQLLRTPEKYVLPEVRVVVLPIANPVGVALGRRSNGNRVDLMRNAPIEAKRATWLVGGQRYSPRLPWFRGEEMEVEARALVDLVLHEARQAPVTVSLDLHSGWGFQDRLWYPFAHTNEPFPEEATIRALGREILPGRKYRLTPQSNTYTTHGDLWDYIYLQHRGHGPLIPLTLEIGSWRWVARNPLQLGRRDGLYNPLSRGPRVRAIRKHLDLVEGLIQALRSPGRWLVNTKSQDNQHVDHTASSPE